MADEKKQDQNPTGRERKSSSGSRRKHEKRDQTRKEGK
jgi:hypothetical protein